MKKLSSKKVVSIVIFIIGLGMCFFPIVSNLVEQQYHKDTVATYEKEVSKKDTESLEKLKEEAVEYNERLFEAKGISGNYSSVGKYKDLLNVTDTGMIGSIDIPCIDINIPIYHGTSEEVLSSAVGHVEGTSLPVGGGDTRSVLTGHRGLPNAKLFTRLDELKKGDLFFVNTLGEKLAYEVYDIDVIEPDDVSKLEIVEGKDLVTLLTCTPYGINSHRLIITGERVDYVEDEYNSIEERMMSARELFFSALPFVILGVVILFIIRKKVVVKLRKGGKVHENKED